MTASINLRVCLYFVLVTTSGLSADAAEVLLKRRCQASGPIVRLGDVADVFAEDRQHADRLLQTELFPAPATQRRVDVDEIRRLLALRSINLVECRFRGSAVVEVVGSEAGNVAQAAYGGESLKTGQAVVAQRRVEEAILDHLRRSADASQSWVVAAPIDAATSRTVLQRNSRLSISGGRSPWVGRQQFVLTAETPQAREKVLVEAEISLPEMVVVATRPIQRGQLVVAGDVELQPKPEQGLVQNPVYLIEDVVGKEMARSVSSGRPIDGSYVQAPRLVQRNDVVTVYSLAGGVSVRTIGRAMEDGARGDVISVVDVNTRKPFRAKAHVVAFQTVEIYALGPTTTRRNNALTTEK